MQSSRRASGASSAGSLSTPVAAVSWSTSRVNVESTQTLYARCEAVLDRMLPLPGMAPYVEIAGTEDAAPLPEHLRYVLDVTPSGAPLDAPSLVRRLFALGAPFSILMNDLLAESGSTRPPLEVLPVEVCLEMRVVKHILYRFWEACAHEYKLDMADSFKISQVFSDQIVELHGPLNTLDRLLERHAAKMARIAAQASSPGSAGSVGSAVIGGTAKTGPILREVPFQGFALLPTAGASQSSLSSSTYGSTYGSSASLAAASSTSLGSAISPTAVGSSIAGPSASASAAALAAANGSTTDIAPMDQRSKVVDELLQTERKYLLDLETLLRYTRDMVDLGIPHETVVRMSPGLVRLIQFERRIVAGIEYQLRTAGADHEKQDFGWLFLHLIPGFDIYKSYVLGHRAATETALSLTTQLKPLSHILEPLYELPSTLLKPIQRILRYPMLLKELLKHTPPEWPHVDSLRAALDAMQALAIDVNETQRHAENKNVTADLYERVRDWKSIDVISLGELQLSGGYPVTNHGSEGEQDYQLFLFMRALLIFRDRAAAKAKPKPRTPGSGSATPGGHSSSGLSSTIGGSLSNTLGSSLSGGASSSSVASTGGGSRRSAQLEIKGRVYLDYVNSVVVTKLSGGLGYQLRVSWGHRNDAGEHGILDIRLPSEELALQWETALLRAHSGLPSGERRGSASVKRLSAGSAGLGGGPSLTNLSLGGLGSSDRLTNTLGPSDRRFSLERLRPSARSSRSGSVASIPQLPSHQGALGPQTPGQPPTNARSSQTSFGHLGRWTSGDGAAADLRSRHSMGSDPNLSSTTPAGTPGSTPSAGTPSSIVTSTGTPGAWEDGPAETFRKLSVSSVNSAHSQGSMPGFRHRSKPSESSASLSVPGQRKVRFYTHGTTFLLLVAPDASFESLVGRVERKLKLTGKIAPTAAPTLRFEYIDEDEDRVQLASDDDLAVAFESVNEQGELAIYVNL